MRLPTILLASSLLLSAGLAACAADDAEDVEASADQDLTILEVVCKAPGVAFDVAPSFGGAAHEGKLVEAGRETLFVCRMTQADAGSTVATCTERPQNVHPGRYTVDVTRAGSGFAATLNRGTDAGAKVALTCATPARPDAGAKDAAADAPSSAVPTYAEVKPIIDRTCGRCHTGVFDALSKVKQRRVTMLSAISAGRMPRGAGTTWRDSPDGQKVLDFLRNSPEL